MPDMTEEEYDALETQYTQNPPQVDPAKKGTGFFTRQTAMSRTVTIDSVTADYLTVKAMASQKTPADIISELVQKEIAASVQ